MKPCRLTVCSFMTIPFSIDTQKPVLTAVLDSSNSSKKFLHDSNTKSIFPRKPFASRNQTDYPPVRRFCTEYKDRTSQLSYWLNSRYHGNRGGICLHCLPDDSSAICWSTHYHKYFIQSVSVALSVTNVVIRKTSPVLWALTFSYNSWNPEWILLLFC